jgi:hypothetical protein
MTVVGVTPQSTVCGALVRTDDVFQGIDVADSAWLMTPGAIRHSAVPGVWMTPTCMIPQPTVHSACGETGIVGRGERPGVTYNGGSP